MSTEAYEYLKGRPLKSILQNKTMVTLPDSSTVEETLSTLSRKKLRSAPVLNTSNKKNPDKILGIIGAVDIVYWILQLTPNPDVLTAREMKTLFIDGDSISQEKVYKLLDKSGLNPLATLLETGDVLSVATKCLGRGIHRVLIVDSEDKIVNTLSRSDICRLLLEGLRNGEMKQLKNLAIKDSVWGGKQKMITVNESDAVLVALDKLRDTKHKSVPVIDKDGILVGNFSASDIKTLTKDAWPHFHEPMNQFMKQYNSNKNVASVTGDETVYAVLEKLVGGTTKKHCLWVVDKNKQVIGSVTMTDILKWIMKSGTKE